MKALVAESEPTRRLVLAESLAQRGHDVTICEDGPSAWRACQTDHYPLVVASSQLPGLDGVELCRRLRGRSCDAPSVVLLLLSEIEATALPDVLAAGADDVLTAPFEPSQVNARLAIAERRLAELTARSVLEARLRDAERANRALLEQIPLLTYANAAAGTGSLPRVIAVSPRIETLLGYTADEWLTDPSLWSRLLHPDDRAPMLAAAAHAAATGEPLHAEYRLIARDGRIVWVHDETRVAQDDAGHPRVWQTVMLDVSEPKRVETALHDAETGYRALVEQLPVVIYTEAANSAGVVGPLLYISPQIETLLGYPAELWLTDHDLWQRTLHLDDRDHTIAQLGAAKATGEPWRAEYRLIARDGRVVWIRGEARLIRDEAGQPRSWQGITLDLTEQKRTEAALRDAEMRFRTLVEQIPAISYTQEPESTVVLIYISPQVETILGYTAAELIAHPGFLTDRLHPDDRERVSAEDERTHCTGEPFRVEYRVRSRDDRWVWLRDEAILIRDEAGTPRHWQGVLYDITEQRETEAALRVSDERLRLALANASMGTWEWDVAAGENLWSEQTGPLFGLPAGAARIAQETFANLLHPEDRGRMKAADRAHIAAGVDYEIEYRVVWPDGSIHWLAERGRVASQDETGHPNRFLGVAMDITARKEAEAALQASEERLRLALDNAAMGIFDQDVPTGQTLLSERMARLFGLPTGVATISERDYFALVHPDDQDRVRAIEQQAIAAGTDFGMEYRVVWPDGTVHWLAERGRATGDDETGHTNRLVGVTMDITARKETKTALREADARYRALVEQMPAIAYTQRFGLQCDLSYVSPRIEATLGYTPDEVTARPGFLTERLHPDDRQRFEVEDARTDATGEPFQLDYRVRARDGHWVWLRDEASLIRDEAGAPLHWQGVLLDVTAQREAEARLHLALENAAMGIWEMDVASGMINWSEQVAPIFGLPLGARTVALDWVLACVHPDDLPSLKAVEQQSISAGADYNIEYRVTWPDGSVHWLAERGRPTGHDETGRTNRILGVVMDITAHKEAEEHLRTSEQRYRELFVAADRQARELTLRDLIRSAIADGISLATFFRQVTQAIAETCEDMRVTLYLRDETDLVLQHQAGPDPGTPHFVIPDDTLTRLFTTGKSVLLTPTDLSAGVPGEPTDGACVILVPLCDAGRVVGVLEIARAGATGLTVGDLRMMTALGEDVNVAIGRARIDTEARVNENRFQTAFDHAPIGMSLSGLDGRCLRVNAALCEMLGYTEDELLTTTFQALTHPDDLPHDLAMRARALAGEITSFEMEKRYYHRQGHLIWVHLGVSLVRDEENRPRYFVSQIKDVTERKAMASRLEQLALHDPLTQLPNRVLFLDRLTAAVSDLQARGQPLAVIFLDLDDFKLINDSLGHDAGDCLLIAVAGRLRDCLRAGDTLSRFGGDEFTSLLEGASIEQARAVATRIIESLKSPFAIGGRETYISASLGITIAHTPGSSPQDLLREADIALYRAKAGGRATIALFEPDMTAAMVMRLEREHALWRAIERDELRLHYQPKVALATDAVVGLEALLRWEHPDHGLLSPGDFIQLAEETGMIIPIGRWALREAASQAYAWRQQFPHAAPPTIGVNLSIRQLRDPDLVPEVARLLNEIGLLPHQLELEMTESVLLDDHADTRTTIARLAHLGTRLAIDDFGTGYSSLAYLRDLPITALKIAKEFVHGLADNSSQAIVRAINALAHDLGMIVTAEGIELPSQATFLRGLGVDQGQGYLFARPLTVEEVEAHLRQADADDWLIPAPRSVTHRSPRGLNGATRTRARRSAPALGAVAPRSEVAPLLGD